MIYSPSFNQGGFWNGGGAYDFDFSSAASGIATGEETISHIWGFNDNLTGITSVKLYVNVQTFNYLPVSGGGWLGESTISCSWDAGVTWTVLADWFGVHRTLSRTYEHFDIPVPPNANLNQLRLKGDVIGGWYTDELLQRYDQSSSLNIYEMYVDADGSVPPSAPSSSQPRICICS